MKSSFIQLRPDFDVRDDTRTYDLRELDTVDLVISRWDGMQAVGHTLLTFGFRDGRDLTLPAETRREEGEPQTGLRGIFNQYELIYILADERDLLRLRTQYRGEEVSLYPTTSTPEAARRLFVDILERINELHENPVFYNISTENCTSALYPHGRKIRSVTRS